MGQGTTIEWATHTFNPWWGCTKVSEGCAHCYAESFAKRVGFSKTGSQFPIWGDTSQRRFFKDKHWAAPTRWNQVAQQLGVMHSVFCGSMCDIMEDQVSLVDATAISEARARTFDMVAELPNLLWLFLTKRPESAAMLLPPRWRKAWPRNAMLGVTIENQRRLDERMAHVVELHHTFPSIQTFASCEPLLSELSWHGQLEYLNWVIGGGESCPGARPMHIDWIRKLRDDCEERTDMCRPWPLPFLFKQWGEYGEPYSRSGYAPVSHSEPRSAYSWGGGTYSLRLGKKKAGRTLDGRTWDGLPNLTYGPQLPRVQNYGAVAQQEPTAKGVS